MRGGAVAGVGDLEAEQRRLVEAGERDEGPRGVVAAAVRPAAAGWVEKEEGRPRREEGRGAEVVRHCAGLGDHLRAARGRAERWWGMGGA